MELWRNIKFEVQATFHEKLTKVDLLDAKTKEKHCRYRLPEMMRDIQNKCSEQG